MTKTVTWPAIGGDNYNIPEDSEENWPDLTDLLEKLGSSAQSILAQKISARVATVTPVNVVSATDCAIITKLDVPGTVEVQLPAGIPGQWFVIVDGSGDADIYNVTVRPDGVETINDQSDYVINKKRAGVLLVYTSGNWSVVGEFTAASSGYVLRSDIASGTPNHVVINGPGGALSSEAQLSPSRGGTGMDNSSATGVQKFASGTGSVDTIVNADVDGAAAIELSKLEALTANRAVVTDANGELIVSDVTDTEVSYLDGVTSSIQTQIDSKADDSDLTNHISDKATHGVTGDIVGTTDTQTLTNKTIDGDDNTLSDIALSSLKTVSGDADKFLARDGSGAVVSTKTVPSGAVVGTTDQQTLTAKIYDGGTASNTSKLIAPKEALSTLEALTRSQGAIYFESNDKKFLGDTGTELKPLGGGGGSGAGRVNYLASSEVAWNFEDSNSPVGWNTYKDTAQDTPVDGTGGTPSDIDIGVTSTNPLNGKYSLILIKDAANAQGCGWAVDFEVPLGYQSSRKGEITFLVDTTASNYASGDLGVFVCDLDNGTILTPEPYQIPKMKDVFSIPFDSVNGVANYRLIFHLRTTNATAFNVLLDDVIFGPGPIAAKVPAVTDWVSYTPTISNVTTSSINGKWRQVGSDMEVQIRAVFSASPSGGLNFSIPTGYNVDSTALAGTADNSSALGVATYNKTGGNYFTGNVVYNGSSNVRAYSNNTNNIWNGTNPVSGGSGDIVTLIFTVPIAEWAGSGTVNVAQANDVEYVSNSSSTDADDNSSFVYGPSGSQGIFGTTALTASRSKRVRFQSPIQPTDEIVMEIYDWNVGGWFPVYQNRNGTLSYVEQGTQQYGVYLSGVSGSTTDVYVVFSRYARTTNGTYASAGADWNSLNSQARWRIRKSKAGSAVGFGAATATQMGLVSAEESGSFTATFTQSGGYSQAVTVKYHRVGKVVSLMFPGFSASATATAVIAAASGTVPASLRPASGEDLRPVFVTESGSTQSTPGAIGVDSAGAITLIRSRATITFTSGSTAGLAGTRQTIVYLID